MIGHWHRIFAANHLAICGIAAAVVGCGAYDATVNGVVRFAGKEVPTGTVSFTPQNAGPTAFSVIQPDGKYSLRTGREEGLPAGPYAVSITAHEQPTAPSKNDGPLPLGKPIAPEWYHNPTTSGLAFTVEPGDNEINLNLTSTPPPGWKPPPKRR